MARRRRKRHSSALPPEDDALAPLSDLDAELSDDASELANNAKTSDVLDDNEAPGNDEGTLTLPDDACLEHPMRSIDRACSQCQRELCEVCATTYQRATLCPDCLGAKLTEPHQGGLLQGFGALLAGLLALAATFGYFAAAQNAAGWLPPIPGGLPTLGYIGTIGGAAGVLWGFSAQDFSGLQQRAGAAGAGLALLALVGVVVLRAMAAFGG